jgi:hypothetical protein
MLKATQLIGFGVGEERDPNISFVKALLHFDGTDGSTTITDSSPAAHSFTANNGAALTTSQSKFGGSALALDGTNDTVSSTSHADYGLGTGDFTVEGWFRFTSTTGDRYLCATAVNTGFAILLSGGVLYTARRDVAGDLSFSWSPTLNQWYFIATSRASGTAHLYIDGSRVATGSVGSNYVQGDLIVGGYNSSLGPFSGQVDDFRWTKGVGRYTGSTCPVPTTPFPNV